MARKKRVYEDDDGRTIADMSGISGPSMLVPRSTSGTSENSSAQPENSDHPWEDSEMSRKERLMCVLGAMKATMLITFAYLIGLGLVIFLLLLLWK